MLYPLFMELENRSVLVIGGGAVAERKVLSLVETGARVTVIAPEATENLQRLADDRTIELRPRKFEESDLEDAVLVISATDDPPTQERVTSAARKRRVPVNAVDQPALCDFIVPAIVRRGDVVVAISTSGKSPALAAALRSKLENVLTHDAARAAQILGELRSEVHARFPDSIRRKAALERVVASGILHWIGSCDDAEALQRARRIIAQSS